MEIELQEVLDALRRHPPFKSLDETILAQLVTDIEIHYQRAGQSVMQAGEANRFLYFIRSGAVEVRLKSGQLYARAGQGELFGHVALIRHGRAAYTVTTLEDSLFYLLPAHWFERLHREHQAFAGFFELADEARLHNALEQLRSASDVSLMTCRVSELMHRQPVAVDIGSNIRDAARSMAEQGLSCLLVMQDSRLVGIVTDSDLRNRVIAAGIDYERPVSAVMTPDPVVMRGSDSAAQAMLTMMRHNVHHIPVLDGPSPVGVVSLSDIIRYETHGSVYLITDVLKAPDIEGLAEVSSRLPQTFVQLVGAAANSAMIGNAVSHVGVAIVQKLLQLGEQQLGPPPIPYCFVALGSQGREEQIIKTDQDNAMVLDDSFDAAHHGDYFRRLATFVSDGLNQCGYVYCPGDIMASNERWRQPLAVWKQTFDEWINKPDGEALLRSSIFFDLRGIHGATRFADELSEFICRNTRDNRSFLAHMAHNATQRKPPLGFFRQFVVEKSGAHSQSINLKARGVTPIIDTVRVHALACGSLEVNTFERLRDVAASPLLTEGKASELIDALELIGMVRIRHQAAQIAAGEPPDNYVRPDALTAFERRHLKDAFGIASRMQEFLKYRYTARSRH